MSHFSNNFSTTMQKLERVKISVFVNSWENVVSKKLVMLTAKFRGFAMSYSLLPSKRSRGSTNSLLKEE
jgi:hypothetical protein